MFIILSLQAQDERTRLNGGQYYTKTIKNELY